MSYLKDLDVGLEISKGNVVGHTTKFIFGRNPDVDTAANEDIWANGGDYVPPTTARVHDIASSSANDTSAGTGARTVRVTGLNGSYATVTETVTMNGVSNVATANSYVYIESLQVLTAGSGGTNAGAITATAQTDATVSANMGIGFGRTTLGIYQVPAGYTAYIFGAGVGFQQTTANNFIDIGLYIKPFGGVFYLAALFPLSNSGSSNGQLELKLPLKVLEKEFIKFRSANASANNNDVHCYLEIVLVAN